MHSLMLNILHLIKKPMSGHMTRRSVRMEKTRLFLLIKSSIMYPKEIEVPSQMTQRIIASEWVNSTVMRTFTRCVEGDHYFL